MENIREIIENHNRKFNLKFNEEKHEYTILNNKKLKSTTTKISKYFPFDSKKISREVALRNWSCEDEVLQEWEILRNNGSYIHELAEKYTKAQKLKDEELELIKHVKDFFEENNDYEIIASEIRIFSQLYKLAGTIDLIIKKEDKYYILDWKTSRKEIDKNQIYSMAKRPFQELPNNKFYSYSMQLSCYKQILKEEYDIDIYDSIIVHLKYDQTYKIIDPINLDFESQELLNMN